MTTLPLSSRLPDDAARAVLLGRAWNPRVGGPAVVTVRDGVVHDITAAQAPTVRDVCEMDDPAAWVRDVAGEALGSFADLAANADEAARDAGRPWLLAPIDLQAVKASGVTFVVSLLERVIEEQAKGAPEKAAEIRGEIGRLIGDDLSNLKPGSPEAMAIKERLIARGVWSQYLEVGIGPDAEIFTKAQPMSSVGTGARIGIHPISTWNNPEPEVALVVNSRGTVVGATLGNDVNLRDVEGRSALLLGKAKDNNASCSVGPFLRLFDGAFTLDDVRNAEVALRVEGPEGYVLDGGSSISQISRDPADLVAATINANHQYPDGFVLFLGTMYAPVEDRDEPGGGFTHKIGDVVTISTATLGALSNRVHHSQDCAPWTFGTSHLMRNLAARGLLGA